MKPSDRTSEQKAVLRARQPDLLSAAVDDLADEIGAANDLRKAARDRIEITRQEQRGR